MGVPHKSLYRHVVENHPLVTWLVVFWKDTLALAGQLGQMVLCLRKGKFSDGLKYCLCAILLTAKIPTSNVYMMYFIDHLPFRFLVQSASRQTKLRLVSASVCLCKCFSH